MGFLKDMKNMQKAAKDLQKETGYQRPSLSEAMQQGTAAIQQVTEMQQRATRLHAEGVPGTARILAVRGTGQEINLSPVLDLDLEIVSPSGTTPVTTSQPIPPHQVARFQAGSEVAVLVDATNPAEFVFNWAAV